MYSRGYQGKRPQPRRLTAGLFINAHEVMMEKRKQGNQGARWILRSLRCNEVARSNSTPARQLHELNIQNRHIHFIEIKYCEDTRPGAQLEASQQQHSELRKQLQGAEIIIHPILLGVWGTIYTAHTLDQFIKLGIDLQRSTKLA
eukprot:1148640-Pelagomonas_calceolata.AAC.1